MTHAALNKAFERIEKQRHELLEKLIGYDDKVLNQRPRENDWSVIEVLNHLAIVEEATHKYLMKKTQDLDSAQEAGYKEAFRSAILNIYIGLPVRFKAPTAVIPAGIYASLSEVQTAWGTARKNIQQVWMGLPEEVLNRNWFKNLAVGKLSLMQMVNFIEAHTRRHEKQIWRTLKEVSK